MFPDRYNFTNLIKIIKHPSKLYHELLNIKDSVHTKVGLGLKKFYFTNRYGEPADIVNKEWDNLIILDACRYDIFKSYNIFDGELTPVISKGSNSREFMSGNFDQRKLYDTVYVTANSNIDHMDCEENFYTVLKTYIDGTGGLFPEAVYKKAVQAHSDHPEKRLIVHFMQPHAPYIGEKAKAMEKKLRDVDLALKKVEEMDEKLVGNTEYYIGVNEMRQAINEGYADREDLMELYRENLQIVLERVGKLVQKLDGKTVITSDHGELLGERQYFSPCEYGHPRGIYVPKLRIVPWLEMDFDSRRKIVSEDPIGPVQATEEEIQSNLRQLGYID